MDVRFPALNINSPQHINPLQPQAGHGKDSPAKIKEAAVQFEAILINQMLQSSRASDQEGWMGSEGGEDQNSTLTDFGEQQFAQALASNGGLGIAKMIIADLNKHANR